MPRTPKTRALVRNRGASEAVDENKDTVRSGHQGPHRQYRRIGRVGARRSGLALHRAPDPRSSDWCSRSTRSDGR